MKLTGYYMTAITKFSLEVAANESLDPGYLADRLNIGPVDEVL